MGLEADLVRFYDLIDRLALPQGGVRLLAECSASSGWPRRGVYLFFEPGELRRSSGVGPRVVRVGTHAVSTGSRSLLWGRLRSHRGSRNGGGSHRASIFRTLVGQALIGREGPACPSWGVGSSTGDAVRRLGQPRGAIEAMEGPIERKVSAHLGRTSVLCLAVGGDPSPTSRRAWVERHLIGLLSAGVAVDPPSPGWLGTCSPVHCVRASGLWNQDHVGADYDTDVLDFLASLAEGGAAPPLARPERLPTAGAPAGRWSILTHEHVVAALREIDARGVPPRRRARNTRLWFDGREYPAKYALALAWREATGEELPWDSFTGGWAAARPLRELGFDVDVSP